VFSLRSGTSQLTPHPNDNPDQKILSDSFECVSIFVVKPSVILLADCVSIIDVHFWQKRILVSDDYWPSSATMGDGTDGSSHSLSPLPGAIHGGLSAIATCALLSLVSTAFLFGYLTYQALLKDGRRIVYINQYVALLINLLFADLIQAFGFMLSLRWLHVDGIMAGTSACWTQGWFINVGDVGSAAFTLAIAIHLFSDIVLNSRLGPLRFLSTVIFIWVFTIFCASIGIAMHPKDFYMRAGLWCWIPEQHMQERLWLHYLWVIITEFSVIIIYSLLFLFLRHRTRRLRWSNEEGSLRGRAEAAARSVIAYPMVYVICTLPAVVIRLKIMAGGSAGTHELILVGVLLASNGWLDAITYSVTRYSLIFGSTIPNGEIRDFQALQNLPNTRTSETMRNSEPHAGGPARMEKIYPSENVRSCATASTDSLCREMAHNKSSNACPGW